MLPMTLDSFFLMIPRPPSSTLFPYTPLFRSREGSSFGLSRVEAPEGLLDAVYEAFGYDAKILLERWVDGTEVSVPILEPAGRSEEHTSELQSRQYLACRLLLEKKQSQRRIKR